MNGLVPSSQEVNNKVTWLIENVEGNILMVIHYHVPLCSPCSMMHGLASIWLEDRTPPRGFLNGGKLDAVLNRTVEKREGPSML